MRANFSPGEREPGKTSVRPRSFRFRLHQRNRAPRGSNAPLFHPHSIWPFRRLMSGTQLAGDQKPNRQVAVDLSCEALASAMTEIEHDPQSGQPERDGGERQEHVNHGVRTFEPALPELDLPKRPIGKGCGIFRRFPIPAPDPKNSRTGLTAGPTPSGFHRFATSSSTRSRKAASFIKHAGKTKNFVHRLAAACHRQNLATVFALV
jgi:hypothetical protein